MNRGVIRQPVFRDQLKSKALQRVADQQRCGLVEFNVTGGFAAPQNVVVHARQVVMHQRICVDEFNRNPGCRRASRLGTDNFTGGKSQ